MRDTIHRLDGVALDVEVRTVVFIEHGRPAAHLSRFPSLPVIFMSGYSSSALTGAGEVARHELLIEKPFTATSLLALVSTLVALQAH